MEYILVNRLLQKILFEKKWWLFRHLLFWVFIYLDEFLSLLGITEPLEDPALLISFLLDVAVVYVNIYLLFPKFLRKRRIVEYLCYTFLTVLLLVSAEYGILRIYFQEENISLSFFIGVFVATSVTMSAAIATKVLKEAYLENQLREAAEREKLQFELKNLKKQVNPHFLFNVLNGIYVQSLSNYKDVPQTIMRFSDLLRYQIYDAEKSDRILLIKEVEFIENYIALEEMRRDNTDVVFQHKIEDNNFKIEPLLFLPLVENAFKYSVPTSSEKSRIYFDLVQKGTLFCFKSENSMGQLVVNQSNDSHGLGLANLKKRLELIYPGKHQLDIIDASKLGTFKVRLEIQINELHNNR
jgi:LytS/YehU family sensor histidine kinase